MADYPQAGSSMLSTWGQTTQPTAYQGPMIPGQDESAFRTSGIERSGGNVLGAYTQYNAPIGPNPAPTRNQTPSPSPSPSGTNLRDPNANPGPGWFWDAADGWKQSGGGVDDAAIDALFSDAMNVYNQAEANLRGQQPGLIAEAEAQANASRGLLQNQKTNANELLGQQEQNTQTQKERQQAQQRQTFQELQMANQQRFGGASSAGLGASELQGREFQKSQFGIQENAQQALQQIGQQKQQVEREYSQGLQQLEVNKQKAINEVNRTFQDRLLEINARRGETQAAKAQARLQALQELRNQAYQINVARMQFENDLKLQAQQNMSQLQQAENQFASYGQAGSQAYNQFSGYNPSGISGVQGSTQQTSGYNPVGQMSRRPEDQYVGSIMGSSETDPRFVNYVPR